MRTPRFNNFFNSAGQVWPLLTALSLASTTSQLPLGSGKSFAAPYPKYATATVGLALEPFAAAVSVGQIRWVSKVTVMLSLLGSRPLRRSYISPCSL
jgi:hypothetical protein